jgi:hypothetical protein
MQDFAPFIPEFQGALSGRKGRRTVVLLFNFLLLLQNLLTSLTLGHKVIGIKRCHHGMSV